MRLPDPVDPETGDYQGLLLSAHPTLKDPNFRRSVLLLTMHDMTTGAFGFVLNRPLGKTAADLLPDHESQKMLALVPVYIGGPVGQEQMGFAGLDWDHEKKELNLETHLSLEDVADRLTTNPAGVRAFVGYSGWAAGQLEGELAQKAWVLTRPMPWTAKFASHDRLWFRVMNSLGPAYKLLAAVPDDPSLN